MATTSFMILPLSNVLHIMADLLQLRIAAPKQALYWTLAVIGWLHEALPLDHLHALKLSGKVDYD